MFKYFHISKLIKKNYIFLKFDNDNVKTKLFQIRITLNKNQLK